MIPSVKMSPGDIIDTSSHLFQTHLENDNSKKL